jgi:hypothetical protein
MPQNSNYVITGNFTQFSSGRLILDAAQTGWEKVNISGSATLGGNLTVYTPPGAQNGWVYDVMTFGSYTGNFASHTPPNVYTYMFVPPSMGQPWKLIIRQSSGGGGMP